MNRLFTIAISLLFSCIAVLARNIYYNSNYVDYIACVKTLNHDENGKFTIPKQSETPESYKPYYLWHYGRHGSRYHYSQEDYDYILNILSKADSTNNLTPFGKELYQDIKKICKNAEMRAGDLTPRGVAQHKGIAKRMFVNFPELFDYDSKIKVKSSTSTRCLLSMNAFTSELLANNPNLKIDVESSKKYMPFISFGGTIGTGEKVKNLDTFYANRAYKGDIVSRVFKNGKTDDKNNFIRVLYYMVITLQGVDIPDLDERHCSLTELFTEEEMAQQWQMQNIYWYKDVAYGNKQASKLIKEFLNDVYIAETGNEIIKANLMFGHDTGLLPLVALMNLDGAGNEYNDAETLHKYWQDYKIIPMAGNLQIIFFKAKNKGEEKPKLVKFLLNEREVKLPIEAYSGVFYEWDKVKEYLMNIVKNNPFETK